LDSIEPMTTLLSPYIIVISLLNEFSKADEPLYQQDVISNCSISWRYNIAE